MVSPPLEYNFDTSNLPDVILGDPNTPEQFSHIPVGVEDVEREVDGHIQDRLNFADSAKRSAIYETVSNSPVIVAALMGDMGAALNVAKTIPVYWEFGRGYYEGNETARRLARAKRIDKAYREKYGYSDARIYHALGLELTSDPELLNRPIDNERERLIEDSIKIVPSLKVRISRVRNRLQKAQENLEYTGMILMNDTSGAILEGIGNIDDAVTNAAKAVYKFDYKTTITDFAKGCRSDVVHLFPSKAAWDDLMSVKKKDIKQLNISNIYNSFHAHHFGIAGTFTVACGIVVHQTVDHVLMPPVRYVYNEYAKSKVDYALDKIAYYASPITKQFKKLASLWNNKQQAEDITDEDDDDFKIKSKPVTNPVNLHREDREYQRIMRARQKDLRGSAFNTAALVGETYFVKSVGMDAYKTLQGADYGFEDFWDSTGEIGKGAFFALSAILATAANNHICHARIDIFNRLQSQRSQVARINAQKISTENSIRIVKENIKKSDIENDPEAWFRDTIETLTLLAKIERRSFRRAEREQIRVFLHDVSEDIAIYDLALGDEGKKTQVLKEQLARIDENYFKELPPLPGEQTSPESVPT